MNFGDLPREYSSPENSKVVILPVPYDKTSTWMKGADHGPHALIKASMNMELYDIETDSEIYKIGIHTARPVDEDSSPKAMVDAVYKRTLDYLEKDKFTVVIGGEHSVSNGTIKAHFEYFNDLTILQIDAHSDLRREYEGSKYNHACVMARAQELGPIVQVGIRSMDAEEKQYVERDRIFYAHERHTNPGWMEQAIDKLTENVYITLDLDAFDPSIMPNTGTPEPGGMFWYEVMNLIRRVNEECNLVGFDVVELCPNEINKAPDFMAAKLIYQILTHRFLNEVK
ncbi:MAG: agmatinase [Bacteroidales bacterium]|nr:agmatinase [Bacteroidales bacterium]